jgi:DNA invertase Pin-like site-specific DNA recombinase
MKALGYQRISTLQQTDGEGLGVQREKIEAWCKYQGIPLVGIEEDIGISGAATENRPGFRRAIRVALGLGSEGVLVVAKLDRLGRNALDVQETLALLLDAGVRVVSLGDGVDSASGMGGAILKLLTNILATFAELEKETIRTRLLDARRRADREGRRYASEPRYGRRVGEDGRTLAADPVETAIVERVRHSVRPANRTGSSARHFTPKGTAHVGRLRGRRPWCEGSPPGCGRLREPQRRRGSSGCGRRFLPRKLRRHNALAEGAAVVISASYASNFCYTEVHVAKPRSHG